MDTISNHSQPFFSVIIPAYNRADFIARSVSSVLTQTFTSWELIIVDDGSTDNTEQVVSTFKDTRIKYIWQKHAERSAARNRGIETACGKYICFLDSDDYYFDFHLQTFYDQIQDNHSIDAVYFCNTMTDCDGTVTELPFNPRPAQNNVEFVLINLIGVPRVCISREILADFKFNEQIRIGEDRDLLARIIAKHAIIHIPVSTQAYVVHPRQSIAIENYSSYLENLKTTRHLVRTFGHYLSRKSRRYILAQSYHNMLLHHLSGRRPLKALYWLFRICICDLEFIRKSDLITLHGLIRPQPGKISSSSHPL